MMIELTKEQITDTIYALLCEITEENKCLEMDIRLGRDQKYATGRIGGYREIIKVLKQGVRDGS